MNDSICREGNQTWTDCPLCKAEGAVAPSFVTPGITLNGTTALVPADERSQCLDCDAIVIF